MVALGLGVGLLIGLTGLGAGSLLTPLLILLAGMSPAIAVGTSLAFSVVTRIYGSWTFYRRGLVNLKIVRELSWGGVAGAVAGGLVIRYLSRQDPHLLEALLLRAIGIVLILISLVMVLKLLPLGERRARLNPIPRLAESHRRGLVTLVAFAIGAELTLTSIGAGAALVPVMSILYKLDMGTLVGTNLVVGMLLAAFSLAPRLGLGAVDWWSVAALACGSIPALWFSSRLHGRIPRYVPEGMIATALFGLGLRIIWF
jgi:uncharacterized protein